MNLGFGEHGLSSRKGAINVGPTKTRSLWRIATESIRFPPDFLHDPCETTRGIVCENHCAFPHHVGDAKRFRRLEVSRFSGGKVVEDTWRYDRASPMNLNGSEEVSRCRGVNLAQLSLRAGFSAAVLEPFSRIDVQFNVAYGNDFHFHSSAVFRDAERLIGRHLPERGFKRKPFELCCLRLNEALLGGGVDIPKRCRKGEEVKCKAASMRGEPLKCAAQGF